MLIDNVDTDELLSTGHNSPKHALGDQYYDHETGTLYEYGLFDNGSGNVAAAAGVPVGILKNQANPFKVTTDYSDSDTSAFKGVLLAVVTDGYYCWYARRGKVKAVVDNSGSSIAAPAPLYWGADGELSAATVGTHHVVASLLEAAAGSSAGGATLSLYVDLK